MRNYNFLALGLNPIKLSEGLLGEVVEVAARYKDRCNMDKIITDSRWRKDIPMDKVGSDNPVLTRTTANGHVKPEKVTA